MNEEKQTNVVKGPWEYKRQYMEIEGFAEVFPIIIYKNAVEKQMKYYKQGLYTVLVKVNNNDDMCCLIPASMEETEQQILFRTHRDNKDYID